MPDIKDDFTVIVDTREQQPWSFTKYATASKKLDTGDYSIEGFEDILAIERKKSINEVANNIVESRFVDVIDRMSKYKYAYFLLEFNIGNVLDYPIGSSLPKRMWNKIRIKPAFIMKHILDWQLKYNIQVLFCDSSENAARTAEYIMKKIFYMEINQKLKKEK